METVTAEKDALRFLEGEERDKLVFACLKSRWLTQGLQPTRNNAPETSPFSFQIAESIKDLRDYFRGSPHGIREGVVFKALAFVQQVDCGDEWLVLRRILDDESGNTYWMPFESASFGRAVKHAARFECTIEALLNAEPFDTAVLLGRGQSTRQRKRLNRSGS